MEAHLMGDEINTVSSHHVKGGVGDVYDSGYTEDKGKPNGEKGVYTPTDQTAYNNVYHESHYYPSTSENMETARPFELQRAGAGAP
jgi:hypothetical protein